jgi:hypothetical protein
VSERRLREEDKKKGVCVTTWKSEATVLLLLEASVLYSKSRVLE